MSKIAIGGDVHGSVGQITEHLRRAHEQDAHLYLQLGDWNLHQDPKFISEVEAQAEKYDIRIQWLDGNHDDFPFINLINPDDKKSLIRVSDHVYYMPRNLQFTLDGLKFHVIGGAHSIDEAFRVLDRDLYAEEDITTADIEYAKTLPTADILLSHDCPSTVPNPITTNFVSQTQARRTFGPGALDRCAENQERLTQITNHIDPSLIFHGHYHFNYERYSVNTKTGKRFLTIGLDEGSRQDSLLITTTQELKECINSLNLISIT